MAEVESTIATTVTKRSTASVMVEPLGLRSSYPRDHSISVAISLNDDADGVRARRVARAALAGFAPPAGEPDQRKFVDVSAARKPAKGGGLAAGVLIRVEGSVVWPGRPAADSMTELKNTLVREGYRVAVREKRECTEPACKVDATMEWERPTDVPSGWHDIQICGRHNYRTCIGCKTIYSMTSTNFVGPAPSLHCEVCGHVLIEWGSSKLWTAEPVVHDAPR